MNLTKIFIATLTASAFLFHSCGNTSSETTETEEITETVEESNTQEMDITMEQPQAAVDVSDEELAQFVDVVQKLQGYNMSVQTEMVAAVEEIGLDVNRFSEIQQSQQNPDANVDVTTQELELYQQALQVLDTKQAEAQATMQQMMEDNGMTEQRYQEIGMAIQSDPDMMAKFQEMSESL